MIAAEVAVFRPEVLAAFAQRILRRCGVSAGQARITATVLVDADLGGQVAHGLMLLPSYVRRLRQGLIETGRRPRVVFRRGGLLVIDAHNCLGPVAGWYAMDRCIAQARRSGVAAVSVRNANHFGAAGVFARRAADTGMIGLAAANGAAVMAPWGAAQPFLGTNPLAVAVPTRSFPVVLDFATSALARGRIILAARNGEGLPDGVALNVDGRPTRDARQALEGAVLPFGGHKGSGLAVMLEMLTGVLSGGAFGPHVKALHENLSGPQGTCHFFLAIDVGRIWPGQEFQTRAESFLAELRGLRPAHGVARVLAPGDPEADARARHAREGITLPEDVVGALRALGGEVGVALTARPEDRG